MLKLRQRKGIWQEPEGNRGPVHRRAKGLYGRIHHEALPWCQRGQISDREPVEPPLECHRFVGHGGNEADRKMGRRRVPAAVTERAQLLDPSRPISDSVDREPARNSGKRFGAHWNPPRQRPTPAVSSSLLDQNRELARQCGHNDQVNTERRSIRAGTRHPAN